MFYPFLGCNTNIESSNGQDIMVSVGNGIEPFPDELVQFVSEGFSPKILERGDFNKGGLSDYIVVLEKLLPEGLGEKKTLELNNRLNSLGLIILRQRDNELQLHTRNVGAMPQWYVLGMEDGRELKVVADSLGGGFTISYIIRDIATQGLYYIDDFHFTYNDTTASFYLKNVKGEMGILGPELHPELLKIPLKEYRPKTFALDIELGTVPFKSFNLIEYMRAGGPPENKQP